MSNSLCKNPLFSATIALVATVLLLSPLCLGESAATPTYNLSANLNPKANKVTGKQTITFQNTLQQPAPRVVFLLRGNMFRSPNPYVNKSLIDQQYPAGFDPGWTKIQSVSTTGKRKVSHHLDALPPSMQTYSLKGTLLVVEFDTPLAAGEKATLTIEFQTKIPYKKTGDSEHYRNVYLWRFGWYPLLTPPDWWLSSGNQRQEWLFPAANYQVDLTIPKDWKFGGLTQTVSQISNKKKKIEYRGGPVRSYSLLASPRYKSYTITFRQIPVKVLYFPGYEQEARVLATYAREILSYYTDLLGSYNHDHLTIAQSPLSGHFGFASSGLVMLGGSFFTQRNLGFSSILDRLTNYILAHEIAHQWYGIGVGTNYNAQNWISEGFAEFLSVRYFEQQYGAEGGNLFSFKRSGLLRNAIESQLGFMNLRVHQFELPYILNFQKGFDEAIIKPTKQVQYANATQTRIYKKGYLVLRTIQNKIGQETMNIFLRRAYQAYKETIATVNELQKIAAEVSRAEVAPYFTDWLFTDRYCDYAVTDLTAVKTTQDILKYNITLTQKGDLTAPVTIKLHLENGESKLIQNKVAPKATEKISFSTSSPVNKVTVDPNHKVMDVERKNNIYPRQVKVVMGKAALPLDAHLVEVGPSGVRGSFPGEYSWQVGPAGYAAGNLTINRNLSISAGLQVAGNTWSDLTGEGYLQSSWTRWSHPRDGFASKNWIPNRNLSVSLRRSNTEKGVVNTLQGTYRATRRIVDNRSLNIEGATSLPVFDTTTNFATLQFSARDSNRLLPQVYLHFSGKVGLSTGTVPRRFQFDLSELHSYGKWNENGLTGISWKRKEFPGEYKFFLKTALDLPFSTNLNYYIGDLVVITSVRENFWAAIGNTTDSLQQDIFSDIKYEGGVELTVSATTLGGLFPIDLSLGYAYHGQGTGHQYLSILSPL